MKILAALIVVMLLSGCVTKGTGLDLRPGKIILGNIDSALLEACDLPVNIPRKKLSQAEVEKYWSIDRKNLVICAKRHGLLGVAIRFRDKLIQQGKPLKQKER